MKRKEHYAFMNRIAFCKKWLVAALCMALLASCALGETYRAGDEADEIATIQTALTTLKTPEIEECQRLANWGLN